MYARSLQCVGIQYPAVLGNALSSEIFFLQVTFTVFVNKIQLDVINYDTLLQQIWFVLGSGHI